MSLDEWWLLGTARCIVGAGSCGAIVRTTDGGSKFAGIPSPPVSAGDVTQLRFANALDGYAFDPQLWETTDGGTHWADIATTGRVSNVEAADGKAYALECLGSSCQSQELLRSTVGAGDWQRLPTPVPLAYQATLAVNGTYLYILSGAGQTHPGVLVYSADMGSHTSTRTDPCPQGLGGTVAPAADGSGALWAACPTGTRAEGVLSTNGGVSWSTTTPTTPAAGEGFDNALQFAAASSSLALAWPSEQGDGGGLDRTTNGGQSYSVTLSGSSSARIAWAGFSDPSRAYALLGVPPSEKLFESNDAGATWASVAIRS